MAEEKSLGATLEAAAAFGVLADIDRFKVIAAIAIGSSDLDDIVRTTGVERRAAEKALSRLVAADLVANEDGFWRGERLKAIPAARSKRLEVLDHLAQSFEPGRTYTEAEVNGVLSRFHEDYASLRRYMVDDGLLDRAEGKYWRSGGTFDV
jgi:hypothetical protein